MRTLILIILPALVLGCVADTARVGETYPPRPSDWPISIYATGNAPPGVARIAQSGTPPGKMVGRFKIGGVRTDSWSDLVNRARSEARSMGGDSVLVNNGDIYLRTIYGSIYRSNPAP